jgi:G3E family GTPase
MIPAASGPHCTLTVIGGFLGAGKTTFLNRFLATAQGRTAVLVNDFGAVNVDASLIAGHDGRTLRLTNGCVCCSLADGFIDTLMRVLAEPFDHIIIEASGVADPWAIAEIALVEPSLALAGVIVLADAARLPALLGDNRVGDTVRTQIRAADIVVLNKIDLVDAAGLAAARAALAAVKPQLRIVDAVDASLPADVIAGVPPPARARSRLRASAASHEATFGRILYRRQACFDAPRLAAALDAMPASLLRLKGTVVLSDTAQPQLLQMVGARWTLSAAPTDPDRWPIELVGIGIDAVADPPVVERSLDTALAPRA